MSEELTTEQALAVEEAKLQDSKPTYYSAITQQEEIIGDDLEAFAILVDPDLREEIIDRMGESNEGNPQRQRLYTEALTFEESNASLDLEDRERMVAGFGSFRTRVLQSPKGTSTEVAPLVQDVQRGLGVVTEQRERAYHTLQTARTLRYLNERSEGSQDEIQQRQSWEGVLSAYRD